jgi:hypothetical protein
MKSGLQIDCLQFLEIVISFRDYEHSVTAKISPITEKRENGIDKF